MKVIALIFLSFITSLCILTGCESSINDKTTESELTDPPPEVIEFTSLDRFKRTKENGGLSHIGIDSSADLYVPTVIPDGYHLYYIAVSYGSVLLRYLPEEYTDSQESIWDAQNDNKHFALWYALPNAEIPNTRAVLLEQFDASETDFIAEKYLFYKPSSFFWVEEETMFSISLPITIVTPFASVLRDEGIDGKEIMSYDGFGELMNYLRVEHIH